MSSGLHEADKDGALEHTASEDREDEAGVAERTHQEANYDRSQLEANVLSYGDHGRLEGG